MVRSTDAVTGADFVTGWSVGAVALVAVLVLLVPYLLVWVRARRTSGQQGPASVGRLLLYLTAGVGTFVYAVLGPLQTYRTQLYWVAALQVAVLAYITPLGLALGDPLRVAAGARGKPTSTPRLLRSLPARLVMFPAVSSLLAIGSVLVVFLTPYLEASMRTGAVEVLLVVQLVGTGSVFVVPLVTEELLPQWASPGVRVVIAFVDGLLDAIPGIVVMTSAALLAPGFPGFQADGHGLGDPHFDQQLAGGLLLAVSEVVGLPLIGVVFLEWMRSDEQAAAAADAVLDTPPNPASADSAAPGQSTLWWEGDPRFRGRFRPDRP